MYIVTSDFTKFRRFGKLEEAIKVANEQIAGVYIKTNGRLDRIHWPE